MSEASEMTKLFGISERAARHASQLAGDAGRTNKFRVNTLHQIMTKNKKIIIGILILIIIISIYSFFHWKKENEAGFMSFEGLVITETNNEKIIKHKKMGLEMKIPIDWQIINNSSSFEDYHSLILVSQDFQQHPKAFYDAQIPKQGCGIEITIGKVAQSNSDSSYYTYIQNQIKLCLKQECNGEIREVNGNKAFQYTYYNQPEDQLNSLGYSSVKMPKNEKIYEFAVYFADEKNRCLQEFNQFLETVTID